jgi:hypothetical protein
MDLFVAICETLFYTALMLFAMIIVMMLDIHRRVKNKEVKIC